MDHSSKNKGEEVVVHDDQIWGEIDDLKTLDVNKEETVQRHKDWERVIYLLSEFNTRDDNRPKNRRMTKRKNGEEKRKPVLVSPAFRSASKYGGHIDLLHLFALLLILIGERVRVDAMGPEAGVVRGGEVVERGELLLHLALMVGAALGVPPELARLHLRGGLLPLQPLDHEHRLADRGLRRRPLRVQLLLQRPRRLLRGLLLPHQPRRRGLQLRHPPDQLLRRVVPSARRLRRQLRRPRGRPPLYRPPRRRWVSNRDRIHGGM
ncbi:hypothetical protein EJB05_26661, partial [Eragrostis curvula]